ncbi:MAG: RIP metalloprotease RseP [Proteobacteria bacterium]|nr:RIP metalloprotease RseP [Pseudomonadota bacterium]
MTEILSNPIIAMVLMLGGLVLFHELGHFIVGRACGVAVETFSIGFGANIFSKKIGSTTYQVSWLPLGGYVKFYGTTRNEDVPDGVEGKLYHDAPVWKRAFIIFAGPVANFLLAFCIFWIMVMVGMEVPPPTVGDVIEGSRAQVAGILPGDRFVEIEGTRTKSWSDIERTISRNAERELKVMVVREGLERRLVLVPEAVDGVSLFGSKAKIGRAGIALGFPSAVVAVLESESFFGRAGIQTGDRIVSYKNSSGESAKINGFHELLSLLKTWKKTQVKTIEWTVQRIKILPGKDAKPSEVLDGSPRIVSMDLTNWPEVGSLSDRAYAKSLGVEDSHLTIATLQGDSAKALKPGDHIYAWNDTPIRTIFHLQEIMLENKSSSVPLDVYRDGKLEKVIVALKPLEMQKAEGNVTVYVLDAVMLGLSGMPEPAIIQYRNPFVAAGVALAEGASQTAMMISSFWAIITGQLPIKALGGPIMIAKVASDSAKAGFMAFFATMAVISINLGLVNLFPIPVLDGGQLLMLSAERIKGRPLGERTVENFHKLGFVVVLCLIVLAMYNDLSRFWASMVGTVLRTIR